MREKDMRFIIEHLEKHFDKKEVLKDIHFTFEEGKIYGLLGRNGAGTQLTGEGKTIWTGLCSIAEL